MITDSSYDALLKAIPMPVFIVDGDLVVTNTNSNANEVFDIGGSQVRYERWGIVWHNASTHTTMLWDAGIVQIAKNVTFGI